MKYSHLTQIANYLLKFKKIGSISRVADMLLRVEFSGKEALFFDLNKANSAIYKNPNFIPSHIYQAPFDNVLKKRLNSAEIKDIRCLKDNRILKFTCALNGAYKSVKTHLYLEFTGRFTNAIITDENEIIIEALRHIDNDYRKIEVGERLIELSPIDIKEKPALIISDFETFFNDEFKRLNEQNLLNLKAIKRGQIDKKIKNLRLNLESLENENELNEKSANLRLKASVLLANLANLNDYDRDFNLKDFSGKDIKFNLNDSPKISANLYYLKAKKLTQKALGAKFERENLAQKIEFYQNLDKLLKNAKSVGELEILLPKKQKGQKGREKTDENVQNFYFLEYKIMLGRNEKGNIWLLKNARKDDIWMHIKDLSGAHVIIKSNKTKLSDEVLNFGAKICLNFSVKNSGRYEIDYTKRENVKVINGANVNYINYKTLILVK